MADTTNLTCYALAGGGYACSTGLGQPTWLAPSGEACPTPTTIHDNVPIYLALPIVLGIVVICGGIAVALYHLGQLLWKQSVPYRKRMQLLQNMVTDCRRRYPDG